jgi:hypothetical protein
MLRFANSSPREPTFPDTVGKISLASRSRAPGRARHSTGGLPESARQTSMLGVTGKLRPHLEPRRYLSIRYPKGPWKSLDDVEFATLGYVDRSTTADATARSPGTTPTSRQQSSKPSTTVKRKPPSRRSPNNPTVMEPWAVHALWLEQTEISRGRSKPAVSPTAKREFSFFAPFRFSEMSRFPQPEWGHFVDDRRTRPEPSVFPRQV